MSINSWPSYSKIEIEACSRILSSGKVNYWTGSEGKKFESEFEKWCGVEHALSLANGSLALSSAYLSINLGQGDELITTPRTFIATASSAVLLGAKPVFADVDLDSGAITVETIEPLITPKTKAISVVHLAGYPAYMPSIIDLAKSKNILVVEDCAQAHGAQILENGSWRSVGSFGDVAAWSFCQDKIISTGGEGGMITTHRSDLWDSIWSFRDHGKSRKAVYEKKHPEGFRWLHESFGSNFRMTEMQSALGRIQLKNIEETINSRTRNAQILISSLSQFPIIRIPEIPGNLKHAWYKFNCFIRSEALAEGWSRDRIVSEINARGVPAFHGSCSEVYLEKCFQEAGLFPVKRLPNAKELGETSINFLVDPTINYSNMNFYTQIIVDILKQASR